MLSPEPSFYFQKIIARNINSQLQALNWNGMEWHLFLICIFFSLFLVFSFLFVLELNLSLCCQLASRLCQRFASNLSPLSAPISCSSSNSPSFNPEQLTVCRGHWAGGRWQGVVAFKYAPLQQRSYLFSSSFGMQIQYSNS